MAVQETVTKLINKITWNKKSVGLNNTEVTHEYEFTTTADKVYVDKNQHTTVKDFFSWVSSFFNDGNFFAYGSQEPQSTQVRIWIDTSNN